MSIHGPLGATPQSGSFELTDRALDGRADTRAARRGLIGLGGLLVVGLLIGISAGHTGSLLPESIRPVPQSLAGVFGTAGPNLHNGGVLAALGLMFVFYVLTVGVANQLTGRSVLMTIAALHAIVLLAPPLLSTDMFSYQAYARLGAVYGLNPYLNGPHAIALDSLFPFIGAHWSYIPSVYGPVFTGLSYLLAPLSIAAGVVAYKCVAALSSIAIVAMIWHLARMRGVSPTKAVAFVALNPLLLLYGVGGGHNDLLMLAMVVGAIYLFMSYRGRLSGGLVTLAVAVKITAGLLLPFFLVAGGGGADRRLRRDVVLGIAVVAALTAAGAFALFGVGVLNLFPTVQLSQSQGDWHSIPGFLALFSPTVGHVVGYLLTAGFLGFTGWLLRRVWLGQMDWLDAAGWSTLAMLLSASSLLPWYVAWLLPLAALASDRRLVRWAIWLTAIVLSLQLVQDVGSGLFGSFPPGGSPLGL